MRIIIAIILLMFGMTSCQSNISREEIEQIISENESPEAEKKVTKTGVEGIISSGYVINDGKYYFLTTKEDSDGYNSTTMIAYYDFQNKNGDLICQDPLCNHDLYGDCKYSCIEEFYFTDIPGVFYAADWSSGNVVLCRIDLNNDTVTEVYDCGTLSAYVFGIDQNILYFYIIERETQDKQTVKRYHMYALDIKTEELTDMGYMPEGIDNDFGLPLFVYKGMFYYITVDGDLMIAESDFRYIKKIFECGDDRFLYWFFDTNTDELYFNVINKEKRTGTVYVYKDDLVERVDLPHQNIFTFTLTESEIFYTSYDPIYYGVSIAPGNPEVYDYSGGKVYKAERYNTSDAELIYDCGGEYMICGSVSNFYVFDNKIFFDEKTLIHETIDGIEYTYFSSAHGMKKVCVDLISGEMLQITLE